MLVSFIHYGPDSSQAEHYVRTKTLTVTNGEFPLDPVSTVNLNKTTNTAAVPLCCRNPRLSKPAPDTRGDDPYYIKTPKQRLMIRSYQSVKHGTCISEHAATGSPDDREFPPLRGPDWLTGGVSCTGSWPLLSHCAVLQGLN